MLPLARVRHYVACLYVLPSADLHSTTHPSGCAVGSSRSQAGDSLPPDLARLLLPAPPPHAHRTQSLMQLPSLPSLAAPPLLPPPSHAHSQSARFLGSVSMPHAPSPLPSVIGKPLPCLASKFGGEESKAWECERLAVSPTVVARVFTPLRHNTSCSTLMVWSCFRSIWQQCRVWCPSCLPRESLLCSECSFAQLREVPLCSLRCLCLKLML